MLEFSIILIRNLLVVKEKEDEEKVHFEFLMTMIKEEMFNPILYLFQLKNAPEIHKKLDIILMEIAYHTFTCFNPNVIFKTKE